MTANGKEGAATAAPSAVDQAQAWLYRKITEVMGEMGVLARGGHADITSPKANYSYDYITEADLMDAIRPHLIKRQVAVLYSDRILARDDNLVSVEVTLTFADGETGATVTLVGQADGTDYGDKAASKAKTTAVRYLLTKTFLQGGADVDPEQHNVERQRERESGTSRPPAERRQEGAQKPPPILEIRQLFQELDKIADEPEGAATSLTKLAIAEAWNVQMDKWSDLTAEQRTETLARLNEIVWATAQFKDTIPDEGTIARAWATRWPESESMKKRAVEAEKRTKEKQEALRSPTEESRTPGTLTEEEKALAEAEPEPPADSPDGERPDEPKEDKTDGTDAGAAEAAGGDAPGSGAESGASP